MSKKRTYINLVGNAAAVPSKKRKRVIKAKARRGSKAGVTKSRGTSRSSR